MKRFIKTLAGKTILFILCIASVCGLTAGIVGIVLYSENDFEIYRVPEEELRQELVLKNVLRSYGYSILIDEFNASDNDGWNGCEYRITDADGRLVAESGQFAEAESGAVAFSYGVIRDKAGNPTDVFYHYDDGAEDENVEYYTVQLTPIEGSSAAAEVNRLSLVLHYAYAIRYAVYVIVLVSLLILIGSFVALTYAAGRRPDDDTLHPGPLHRVPFDLLAAAGVCAGISLCFAADACTNGQLNEFGVLVCFAGLGVVGLCLGLGLWMSGANRIKQHALIKNTVIYWLLAAAWKVCRRVWKLLRKLTACIVSVIRRLPLIWKTVLTVFGLSFLELIVIIASDGDQEGLVILWLIEKLFLVPAVVWLALTLRRLQRSGDALARGDLAYQTDTRGMLWDFKRHGENLNSIAGGMTIAVEERLKSERMKTELITNVSHDIKTPLTSIINYAALIGNESCDNPRITEYSEVLVRQSEKLKRLIEDLVEASKASTGNLEVSLSPCDAAVFLTQTAGEYEDKLKKTDLTLIVRQPENELRIMADGRRMWRIFDNLMNNVCKYAQPGTRVYLTLEAQNESAVITFKNTSREPLDMSEEELLERFTRGDASRNTEGNGLGLSIAKSMAELQGGTLRLSTDGDLFKAMLTFSLI